MSSGTMGAVLGGAFAFALTLTTGFVLAACVDIVFGPFDGEPGPSAQQCLGIGGVPTPDGLCLLYVAPPPTPLAKQALPAI